MTPVTVPTAIQLPGLDERHAHLAAKLRNLPPEQLANILKADNQ